MESLPSELELVRQSSRLVFLATASNGYNDIHHFEAPGTPYTVALHENAETRKLYAVWINPQKSNSRDGRYARLPEIFDALPVEIQEELLRLRPLLSRCTGPNGVGDSTCSPIADNPPLERTAAAVYFTCGRASRCRRRGRSRVVRVKALTAGVAVGLNRRLRHNW